MKFVSCDYALGARLANLEQSLSGLMCPGFDVSGGHGSVCPSLLPQWTDCFLQGQKTFVDI